MAEPNAPAAVPKAEAAAVAPAPAAPAPAPPAAPAAPAAAPAAPAAPAAAHAAPAAAPAAPPAPKPAPAGGRGPGRPPGPGRGGRGGRGVALVPAPHPRPAQVAPAAKRAKPPPPKPAPPAAQLPAMAQPRKVTELPLESATYRTAVELERKVDALLERRRAEVRESARSEPRPQRTLRLYVWNTVTPPKAAGEPHGWTLHVHGKVLDAGGPAPGAAAAPRFGALLSRLTVRLEESHFPGTAGGAGWAREAAPQGGAGAGGAAPPPPPDGFEIKREAARCPLSGALLDTEAQIQIELAHSPPRYALPPAAARLLGCAHASRAATIHALFAWARAAGALRGADAGGVEVDEAAREALCGPGAAAPTTFAELAEALLSRLTPAPPLSFSYLVKSGAEGATGGAGGALRHAAAAFDVPIDLGEVRANAHAVILQRTSREKEVGDLDSRGAMFIDALVASQARDLEVVAGGAVRQREAERRSDFYRLPWAEEAISHFLIRKEGRNPAPPG